MYVFALAGLMLFCLGTVTNLLDVPKQHGEPTLYGNPIPSDAPHVKYIVVT